MKAIAGGLWDNQSYFGPRVDFNPTLEETSRLMLFDPQTSGGLLLGVPQHSLSAFSARAEQLQQEIWIIGEAVSGKGIRVE
jgi:selenide,water dikinase